MPVPVSRCPLRKESRLKQLSCCGAGGGIVLHITYVSVSKHYTVGGNATDMQPLPRELMDRAKQGIWQGSITPAQHSCQLHPRSLRLRNTEGDVGKRLSKRCGSCAIGTGRADRHGLGHSYTGRVSLRCSLMSAHTASEGLAAASL